MADWTGKFLLPSSPHLRLCGELLFVVRAHVKNEVRGHAEGQVALGAPVLHRHAECGKSRRKDREGRCGLQLSAYVSRPVLRRVMESSV